jgi:hypothetical protein
LKGNPYLWKELHEKPVRIVGRDSSPPMLIACALSIVGYVIVMFALSLSERRADPTVLNGLTMFFCIAVYVFMLLLVALSAAGRFSVEIEKQTLDSLLLVPERFGLLEAKWLGSILHVRQGWWFLGLLLLMCWASGTELYVVLFLFFGWWISTAFHAWLGLWFSLLTRSTARATIFTLLVGLAVCWVSLWLAVQLDYLLESVWDSPHPYHVQPLLEGNVSRQYRAAAHAMTIYALLALGFYELARARFRALTGRPGIFSRSASYHAEVMSADES